MVYQTNYKAQFCRLYFTQLKSFIRKFDVKSNNLGMDFLTVVDKQSFWWDNTIDMADKDLMLAIEEYFFITGKSDTLQGQRETLFSALIDSDKFATDKNVKICFVDDATIKAILSYFGLIGGNEKKFIKDYIKDFDFFAAAVAFGGRLSFANYNKALRLFEFHRNNNAHNIIKQEIPKRKIAFQYLAFTYIGLVYLLRSAWSIKPERLTKYKKPVEFAIPKQALHIVINRQDSTNDHIIGYEFVPNIDKDNERITELVAPTPCLEFTVPVRKYEKFKLIVKYGTSDNNTVNITFGDNEEKMLTYYYWNPTLNINLPSSSNILPGLSIGSNSTEELIAKLLDDVNKQQEGKAKETVSVIVDNLLSELEPTLQRIKELSENPQKASEDEEQCKDLIKEVDFALQKQLNKSEENFQKVLKKINQLNENQANEFQKLTLKAEEHYNDLRKDISSLTEKISKEYISISERRKKYFRLCHLLWLIPLLFVTYYYTFHDNWDRNLLFLMNPWKYASYAAICFFIPCFFVTCIYYINSGNAFIRSEHKWQDIGAAVFFIVLYCLLFLTIPYPSVDKFIENYDFTIHNGTYHKKASVLAENYLKENEDSENARILLAQYYLNYSNNINKALIVTEPLKAGSKIGTFYAAMALYKHGEKNDFSQIRNILDMYLEEHKDSLTLDILYLKGIMLLEGKGVDRDVMKSISYLLNATTKNTDNDIRTKTMSDEVYAELGHILSNNLSGFNDDSLFTSFYESTIEIKSKNSTKDTITIQPFNLPAATYFLKKVSSYKPIAAIDLGNIYKDLNMLDSALYYYDTAIRIAQDSLQKEAIFRKSLICEKMGISLSKKETSLLFAYKPARFHKAVQMMKNGNNDRNRLIEEFDASYDTSIVHKRLYIAPHVFIHIEKGDSLSALSILKNTRPEGNFNEEFVRGVKYILNGKDSIGLHWMTLSAEKGCNYAAMICYYKEMEYGPVILSKIQKMCSLGIPFANVLACKLLLQTDLYPLAYKYAAKAMALGHPAGALAIKLGDNFRLINEALDIENSSERQQGLLYGLRQLMQMGMRMASDKWILDKYIGENLSEKNFYLNDVIELDCIHYKQLERRNTMPQRNFRLWSDIAINNNCISAEIQLLAFAHRLNDIEYENKLLESAFSIVNEKDWIHDYGNLSLYIHGYKQPLYIDSLESVYKNNTFKQGLLSRSSFVDSLKKWQSYPYFKIFKDLRYLYTPLSGRSYFLQNHITLNNLYLLDEFVSYIDDDWYTRSIK